MSVRRGMALLAGMPVVYGNKVVWAQKYGRWRTSEKRSIQEIGGSVGGGRIKYVERHVLRQVKVEGGDLTRTVLSKPAILSTL